jgi:hypothetical protein
MGILITLCVMSELVSTMHGLFAVLAGILEKSKVPLFDVNMMKC